MVRLEVLAEQRPEEDGRLAAGEDVLAVALVKVEVPAAGRNPRGHAGDRLGLVHDLARAVGGEVHQHVQDPTLALAAALVDVGGVHARVHATGVDGDRGRVVGDAGRSLRYAVAGALRGELERGQRLRAGRDPVVQVRGRGDDL